MAREGFKLGALASNKSGDLIPVMETGVDPTGAPLTDSSYVSYIPIIKKASSDTISKFAMQSPYLRYVNLEVKIEEFRFSTDNQTYWNQAFNRAYSILNAFGGGKILIDDKVYQIDCSTQTTFSDRAIIAQSNVSIVGRSKYSSIIKFVGGAGDSSGIRPNFGKSNIGFYNLRFEADSNRVIAVQAYTVYGLYIDNVTHNCPLVNIWSGTETDNNTRLGSNSGTLPNRISKDVRITNFTGVGYTRQYGYGIYIRFAIGVTVSNGTLAHYFQGVECWGGDAAAEGSPTVEHKCSDIFVSDISVSDIQGGGVWFSKCKDIMVNNITANEIRDVGVDFEACKNYTYNNLVLTNCRNAGLSFFYGGDTGVGSNVVITRNYPMGGSGHGVYFKNSGASYQWKHTRQTITNLHVTLLKDNPLVIWVSGANANVGDYIWPENTNRSYLVTAAGTVGTTAPTHTVDVNGDPITQAATGGTAMLQYVTLAGDGISTDTNAVIDVEINNANIYTKISTNIRLQSIEEFNLNNITCLREYGAVGINIIGFKRPSFMNKIKVTTLLDPSTDNNLATHGGLIVQDLSGATNQTNFPTQGLTVNGFTAIGYLHAITDSPSNTFISKNLFLNCQGTGNFWHTNNAAYLGRFKNLSAYGDPTSVKIPTPLTPSTDTLVMTVQPIYFDQARQYGTTAVPFTGSSVSISVSGAVKGGLYKPILIHKAATEPTYTTLGGVVAKKASTSGNYVANVNNFITFTYYDDDNIEYTIKQIV